MPPGVRGAQGRTDVQPESLSRGCLPLVAVYRRSSRTRYVLAVLVLAALTIVTIDARSGGSGVTDQVRAKFHDAFSPLQRATHSVLRPIGDFFTGALEYGSLRQENQRLRSQVAGLE